ncbi:MAG: hypothetical protein ACI8RZ_001674 [Myxococcota bacterium]|jgi:hypothetical protein
MLRPTRPFLLLGLLLHTACKKDEVVTPSPGVDPTVLAAAGESRAGVIVAGGEAALFGGITAEGQVGDIKLYNSEVQLILQQAAPGNGYINTGGHIIDADLVREPGTPGRDTVEDFFLAFGFARLFHAETIEVIADGSDGGAAVVCARGGDVEWDFMRGLFEYEEAIIDDLSLDITTLYTLPPDATAVTLTSTLTNTGDEEITFTAQEGSFLSGEDQLPWAAGVGLEGPGSGDIAQVSFTGRRGEATLSQWPTEGMYSISFLAELTASLGIFLADWPIQTLAPGESVVLERTISITPDIADARTMYWEDTGAALGGVLGTITDTSGPVAGVRVSFVDAEQTVQSVAITDAEGRYDAALPPGTWTAYAIAREDGTHVQLPEGSGRYGGLANDAANDTHLAVLSGSASASTLPFATGRTTPEPAELTISADQDTTLDLTLAPASRLVVTVTDTDGNPLPAVLDVQWSEGTPTSVVPDALKDALGVPTSGRATWGWSIGEATIPLLPGLVEVTAGHSWRHGQASASVTVEPGEVTEVTLVLDEVVPRDGWLAMDPHLHASPSFDGALPMEDRLITCAATGVELPVTTDHDAVVDYTALSVALGLSDRMTVIPGFEVTTLARGHFNLFPVTPDPDALNGGAEPWWDTPETTQELFDRMQERAGPDALTQINHPRSPGMFAFANYKPETGEVSREDYWSSDFSLFELLNGGVDGLEEIRADWFSFLQFGWIAVPTGSSDSHYRYIPCGLGRTDVFLDTNDPATVSREQLTEALLAGHVVVASGTTLRAQLSSSSGDALPGDTLVGTDATLSVSVQAPDWIVPGTLRVYLNGEVVIEQALPESAEDGLWLAKSWPVAVDSDSWLAVEVEGDAGQGDLWRNALPYAMTNAFFLDVDGDGWTAPQQWGE